MALTQDEWAELVGEWQKSGESAAQFASAHGVAATALRYWIKRLPVVEATKASTLAKPVAAPRSGITALARVVRPGELPPRRSAEAACVRVVVGKATVLVETGFDEDHLRAVVRALSEVE
ncbi:MAG: hypothetical protein KF837_44850 [Labilithrix sp.]|nr:hypothetical protein [Labilithrix sp.]